MRFKLTFQLFSSAFVIHGDSCPLFSIKLIYWVLRICHLSKYQPDNYLQVLLILSQKKIDQRQTPGYLIRNRGYNKTPPQTLSQLKIVAQV